MIILLNKKILFLFKMAISWSILDYFTEIAIKTSIYNQNQQNKNVSCIEFNFTQ